MVAVHWGYFVCLSVFSLFLLFLFFVLLPSSMTSNAESPSGQQKVGKMFAKAMGSASNLVASARERSAKIIRSVAARHTVREAGMAGELDLTYITPKIVAMAFPAEVCCQLS